MFSTKINLRAIFFVFVLHSNWDARRTTKIKCNQRGAFNAHPITISKCSWMWIWLDARLGVCVCVSFSFPSIHRISALLFIIGFGGFWMGKSDSFFSPAFSMNCWFSIRIQQVFCDFIHLAQLSGIFSRLLYPLSSSSSRKHTYTQQPSNPIDISIQSMQYKVWVNTVISTPSTFLRGYSSFKGVLWRQHK